MTTETTIESNGEFAISTEMMQVINYEEEFNADLGTFLERNKISQRGFDYNVAAIMGPQSSGKSTLLNMLFGTSFRTMDANQGRYQVTQGVWLGRDDERGIVVMDLEGTDSRERGEDAASFERKSALFALALSEVLIVNVWTQDVGRFNAANLSLLKTVMELDLQLFFSGDVRIGDDPSSPRKQGHKTKLLFVLRDHVSTPMESLTKTLRDDVNNIWDSISKPEAAEGTEVTQYFDLAFFALPHKVLMADQFQHEVSRLRSEFMEGEMFLDEYRREVAADGFATYAESIWTTIRDNKELDIPTQKEMLAHVRCDNIAQEVMAAVEKNLEPYNNSLIENSSASPEPVAGLFSSLLAICDEAIQKYVEGAHRYAKSVAQLKEMDLREKLGNDCKALFDSQISIASDNALKEFEKYVVDRKGDRNSAHNSAPWKNWGSVSGDAKKAGLDVFESACVCELIDNADHPLAFAQASVFHARKRLTQALESELTRATENATTKAREFCLRTFDEDFKPNLAMVLDKADDDVWDRASEVAATSWEKTRKSSLSVFGSEGLGLEGDEIEIAVEDELKPECLEASMKCIRDTVGSTSSFLLRMSKRFDDMFRFDERGVPRSFGPEDDLDSLFMTAREEAEKLAELLSEIKLSGPLTSLRQTARSAKESVSRRIFEAHQQNDLRERLHRQAGAAFMEAKRVQEAAKITTRIPIWLIVLLVVLGWNEIMAIFRNPILLFLVLIIGPIAYVLYSSGNATLLVPAVRAVAAPVLQQAQDYVAGINAQAGGGPATPPPVPATSNGRQDNGPDKRHDD